jgi:predicted transposase YbfD/YdcC
VALYEAQTGVVLAQQAVPAKSNEITVEATLLTPAHNHGRIVTADALHTQRACCAQIIRSGGDYVLFAKANQPTLEEDLRLFWSRAASRLPRLAAGADVEQGTWTAGTARTGRQHGTQ